MALTRRDGVGRQGEDLELKVAAAVGTSAKGPARSGAIGVPLGGLLGQLLPEGSGGIFSPAGQTDNDGAVLDARNEKRKN